MHTTNKFTVVYLVVSDVYLVLTFFFIHADVPTFPNSSHSPAVPTSPIDTGNMVKHLVTAF